MTSVFFVRGQWIEEDSSESRTWENHYPLLVGRADVIAVNDVINPSLIHHPAKSSPLAGVIEIVRVPQISLMIKDRDLPDPWNPQQLESPAGIHPPFLLKYELSPRISICAHPCPWSWRKLQSVLNGHFGPPLHFTSQIRTQKILPHCTKVKNRALWPS